jgi:hypothetical protein
MRCKRCPSFSRVVPKKGLQWRDEHEGTDKNPKLNRVQMRSRSLKLRFIFQKRGNGAIHRTRSVAILMLNET